MLGRSRGRTKAGGGCPGGGGGGGLESIGTFELPFQPWTAPPRQVMPPSLQCLPRSPERILKDPRQASGAGATFLLTCRGALGGGEPTARDPVDCVLEWTGTLQLACWCREPVGGGHCKPHETHTFTRTYANVPAPTPVTPAVALETVLGDMSRRFSPRSNRIKLWCPSVPLPEAARLRLILATLTIFYTSFCAY